MSLKDDIGFVKEELSSDEKLLESAFKIERIYKKHRLKIWAAAVLLVVGFGGKAAYDAYEHGRLEKADEALSRLLADPADSSALSALRSSNPKLYELYTMHRAIEDGKKSDLAALESSKDKTVSDIASYHRAVLESKSRDSIYYHDLAMLEKAYLSIKAGKKEEAAATLALIPKDSPIDGIAGLLRHYTIK